MLDALAQHMDPVASYLRSAVQADGSIAADWEGVARALGAELGCGEEISGFTPLSNQGLAPKGIVSACPDQPIEASQVLMILEPNEGRTDLSGEAFRVVGWDDAKGAYRRYQFVPGPEEDSLSVAVEPQFCLACHEQREDVDVERSATWHPIMSEMQNPWAQWNAEPGFASFIFEQSLPTSFDGALLERFLSEPLQRSASDLEPIVRAANDRIAAARALSRDQAGDLESAKAWVAPLFCERDANYVSEIHGSGELPWSFLVDPNIKQALLGADALDPQWLFSARDHLLIEPANDDGLAMMPVRSEAARAWELALLSRGVLEGEELLSIRAIDWQRPVFSETRCSLYVDAVSRVGQLTGTKAQVARSLVREALTVGETDLWALDGVVVITSDEDAAKLSTGEVGELLESPAAFGQRVDDYLRGIESASPRTELEDDRVALGCEARARSPIAPTIPGTETCTP